PLPYPTRFRSSAVGRARGAGFWDPATGTSCGPASTLRPAAVIDGRKSHTQGRASAHIQPTTCGSAALDNTPARTRGFGANWSTGLANRPAGLLGYWAVGLLGCSAIGRIVLLAMRRNASRAGSLRAGRRARVHRRSKSPSARFATAKIPTIVVRRRSE